MEPTLWEYPIYKEWIDAPGLTYKFISNKEAICVQQENDPTERQDSVQIGSNNRSMVEHENCQWKDTDFREEGVEPVKDIYELLGVTKI